MTYWNPMISLSIGILVVLAMFSSIPADDASVTRLTAVRDVYPFWSPDGKMIVFQSDRNSQMEGQDQIYLMMADGSSIRRLTNSGFSDEGPVWSPDGSSVLFSSYITDENSELYLIDVSGSNLRRITRNPGWDGHPKFSPDGNRIIFNSVRNDSEYYDIYEMNLDGSEISALTDFDGWDTYPSISPDGTKILWRRVLSEDVGGETKYNSEIFLMNRDGSDPINLSNHPSFDGYPSWSPDGSKIAFASNRDCQDDSKGNFHIFVMNADGTESTKVLENEPHVEDARPMWSPDGTKLLFNRQYVADESSIDILVVELPKGLQSSPK